MTIACRTQRGNCLLKQWSLETTQQKALTKYNRQVSAIVRVPMVTVVAVENLVHLWVQTISFKSEKKQAIERSGTLPAVHFLIKTTVELQIVFKCLT